MGAGSIEVLETILGCSLQEASNILTGRVLVASSYPESAARRARVAARRP